MSGLILSGYRMKNIIFLIIFLSACSTPNDRKVASEPMDCREVLASFFRIKTDAPIDAREDSNPLIRFFNNYFTESRDEEILLRNEHLWSIVQGGSVAEIKKQFENYAIKNNVLYEEKNGVYYILLNRQSSALNRFADSVVKILKVNKDKDVNFIFDPVKASRFGGAYTLNGDIYISLTSIADGKPSAVEIHEILHLVNDLEFRQGETKILRAFVTPYRLPFVGGSNYAYAKGFSLDEIETHASDLRLFKRLLLNQDKLSAESRKILLKNVRFKLKVLSEIGSVLETELNNYFKAMAKSSDEIKFIFKVDRFNSGNEYVKIMVPYVNLFTIDSTDIEMINAVKVLLEKNNSDHHSLEFAAVKKFYFDRIQKIAELHGQIYPIILQMVHKSKDDSYLTANYFFDDLEKMRSILGQH